MDTLHCIHAFAKVVEAGSFAGAARRLSLSPATVTKRIQHLERRLGTRLFNRNTRQVRLTEAGARYARHCGAMLAELAQVEAEVAEMGRLPQGRLKITAAYDFGVRELEPAALAFARQYPEIKLDLQLTQRFVDLSKEDFDLAVRCVTVPGEADLIVRRLATSRLIACAAPEYLRRHGRPKVPADLQRHNCLVYTGTPWKNEWSFMRDGCAETIRISGNLRTNDNGLLRRAVIDGIGITIQPTFNIWQDLQAGQLERVLGGWRLEELGIYVVFPQRRYLPGKVRAFVDFLASHFRNSPDRDIWLDKLCPRDAGCTLADRTVIEN
jgi:DNA-binding transcriptional LysR family regulator